MSDEGRERVCCNCENNIRVKDGKGMVEYCMCKEDGHRIGYVACFEGWCSRWKKDRTWDK